MLDPFTIAHQAIWSALNANSQWLALVKVGNQINQSVATFQQPKEAANPSDLPQIMLVQGACLVKPFGSNSQIADFEQTFVLVCTQDRLSVLVINQLKLLTAAALFNAGATLNAVDASGNPFIRRYEVTDGRDSDDEGKFNLGSKRWVSMLSIRVEMFMARAALAAIV